MAHQPVWGGHLWGVSAMRISLATDYLASGPVPAPEIVRALRELANRIEADGLPSPSTLWHLEDSRGRAIGAVDGT